MTALGAGAVRELLDRHGIRPSRALGQNFLVDPNTARRIADRAGVGPGDRVLEIGPGIGSLTVALAAAGGVVTAVELDRYVLPALEEVTATLDPPVRIVQGDALEIDLDSLVAGCEPTPWRLAANLPYNAGTQILLRLLADAPVVGGGAILVQREVADRLCAPPAHRQRGIPSVKVAWWAATELAGVVPPTVFHPRPRVESAIVTFERREPPAGDDVRRRAFALVDSAFGQRRKMLRRSLGTLVAPGAFEAAAIDPTRRPETLTLDEWVRLAAVGDGWHDGSSEGGRGGRS